MNEKKRNKFLILKKSVKKIVLNKNIESDKNKLYWKVVTVNDR